LVRRSAAEKLLYAERLRGRMTDSERLLWQYLDGRKLCKLRFDAQVVIAGYIVDFVCPAASLVIEVDGGYHADRVDEDEVREGAIRNEGFGILRFTNDEVDNHLRETLLRLRYWALRGALSGYERDVAEGRRPLWRPALGDTMAAMFDGFPQTSVTFTFNGGEYAAESRRGEWLCELSLWDLTAGGKGPTPVMALIHADNQWLDRFTDPIAFDTLQQDQQVKVFTKIIFPRDEDDNLDSPWGPSPW
jgi:very-short-patch-repair endonuclease